jgi:arsenate reductase-like glutaredoxin family protein
LVVSVWEQSCKSSFIYRYAFLQISLFITCLDTKFKKKCDALLIYLYKYKYDAVKDLIRSRNSKTYRQCNGQKKKDQRSTVVYKILKSNTRILLKHRGERCSGRVGHSCSFVAMVMLHLLNIP